MIKLLPPLAGLLIAAGCAAPEAAPPQPAAPAAAVRDPVVGGATMSSTLSIAVNLAKSADHQTLTSALAAAGLVPTLSGTEAYTLLAPTDAAFAKLPPGTVEALMHPRSRPELEALLRYHIVRDRKTSAEVRSGGSASWSTAAGGMLRANAQGGRLTLTDANGRRSTVTQADIAQSNGVFHVLDTVLLPPRG